VDFGTFLIQCLNAVQYGLLLFLVASGLTLIFGIMGVINLAHGSFYMIGAYMAFALAPLFGDQFILHAAGRRRAGGHPRLRAGMGLLQLPVPARPPAAGADDLCG
jgi:branched-subunit amino acid ABC-type transport system permease component